MIKWLGNHVVDFIARFRNDVYLEDISTGTIVSGSNLGLDSNNKIVKATIASGSGDLTAIIAGTGLSGTDLTGPIPTLNVDASIPSITTLAGLTSFGATGVNTIINSDDIQWYNPVNDGNPQLSIGASTAERFVIQPIYNSGAQTLNYILFNTIEAGSTAQKGQYLFQVDSTSILTIKDPGIDFYPNMGISINGTDILTDSSGTATLSNIDALDETTEATIENAIDTLANLTSIGTIATGVWNGDAIASAYLDADTMHYSAQRQLTHHYIASDIGTGVIYISLGEIDAENATISNKNLPLLAPVAGKLLKVFVRTSIDMSGVGLTWGLLTRSLGSSTSGAASVIGTKTVTGPTITEMATCDFTSSVTGTNVIAAGDKVLLSIQGDASSGDCQFFITCLWEWNLS
jgi:hypothetical protein